MSIRILLADDNRGYRETVRALLEHAPGLVVVDEAVDGEAALHKARAMKPDIVLMDVVMPVANGIEATGRLVADLPDVRVLALSMHVDASFVEGMLEAGASGYAVKDIDAEELVRAVRLVAGGGTYLSPGIDGHTDPVNGEG